MTYDLAAIIETSKSEFSGVRKIVVAIPALDQTGKGGGDLSWILHRSPLKEESTLHRSKDLSVQLTNGLIER